MEWKTTNDHEEIKAWVKKNDGFPAIISDTTTPIVPGVVVIAFDDAPNVKRISWDEFFDIFDTRRLTMRYRLNDKGEPDWNFIDPTKNVAGPEDETQLPEDREEYKENVFPSAP